MVIARSSSGMRVFTLVWFGQLVSLVGSGITQFALGLWVYQQTRSVTPFAMTLLFRALPVILLSPFAGALVDRWDKRRVMLVSDAGAALSSLAVAALFFSGGLQVWHIYAAAMICAAFGAFQFPAYVAAATTLVPKDQLGRSSGMMQVAQAAADIGAPLLAGLLVVTIHIPGVLLLDVLTFLFAITTLSVVRFPSVSAERCTPECKPKLRGDIEEAVRYLRQRPGLITLLVFFAVVAFQGGLITALIQPMVLGFTTPDVLGTVLGLGGFGLMLGSLTLSAWGGPPRRADTILVFLLLFGGGIILIGLQPLALTVALGVFAAHFCVPFINGSNQAIWQAKVPVVVQGRIFALRQMVMQGAQLVAFVIAGPLADTLNRVIGSTTNRGAALVFVGMGLAAMVTAVVGYSYPRLRYVESELPDAVAE